MTARMLVNYGKLKRGKEYPVTECGPDWVLIRGLYVHSSFVVCY